MQKIKIFIYFSCAALIVFAGFTVSRFFYASEAQTVNKEVVWKHDEIPLKSVNSKYKLNFSSFSGRDWIVGVKPIKTGEKEKMYIGVLTWADADGEGARQMGFKQLVKMEDYPQDKTFFNEGEATLTNSITSDQTLVIYLEVNAETQMMFEADGKSFSPEKSVDSYLLFNGVQEKAQINNVEALLGMTNVKILKKNITKTF